jgi:hypothetical protein
MTSNNDRVRDICNQAITEQDHDKLMALIRELNRELDATREKKPAESVGQKQQPQRRSHA